jgi:hypothetical protein
MRYYPIVEIEMVLIQPVYIVLLLTQIRAFSLIWDNYRKYNPQKVFKKGKEESSWSVIGKSNPGTGCQIEK